MKVFQTSMSAEVLLRFIRGVYDGVKTECVANPIPDDAVLIHTKFDEQSRCLRLVFCHETIGSDIKEGADIFEYAEWRLPTYKRIE